jgi:hypothetical protein
LARAIASSSPDIFDGNLLIALVNPQFFCFIGKVKVVAWSDKMSGDIRSSGLCSRKVAESTCFNSIP